METGEEWLLRPVQRGFTSLESIENGSVSLEALAMANDYIDVLDENSYRLNEAMKDE